MIWCTLGGLLLATIAGFGWDRAWHATHPFEDFWSPPHLFIYSALALTAGVFARLLYDQQVRGCFGHPTMTVPLAGKISPPLFMAAAGLFTVFMAGGADNLWHTSFGLDETGWSFPHAMLGWGLLLTLFGLTSSRLALSDSRPLGWSSRALLAFLLIVSVVGVFLGPLGNNNSPALVESVASLPVLATEPEAQHTFRIYLEWNITRTAPLFVPLAAFATGVALRLGRGVLPGSLTLLAVVGIASLLSISGELRTARYFGIEDDPQNWLPVPLLPALLTVIGTRTLRVPEWLAWSLAGMAFGVVATSWWDQPGWLALLAALAALGGALLGERIDTAISSPKPRSAVVLAVVVGFLVPACLGAVDLYLRTVTP